VSATGDATAEAMGARLRVRVAVYGMFFVSGLAALIFEVVWSRQFIPVFGCSTYAVSMVLCAFMAGTGMGSLLFGRFADRARDHLLLFALMEGGIVGTGLLVPVLLALLQHAAPSVMSWTGSVAAQSILRFGFSFAVLLAPCMLMGGTLPVLSRFCTERLGAVGRRVSLLYGFNTLGAAAGCFVAGFFLVETLGLSLTSRLAAACCVLVGGAALALRRRAGALALSAPPSPGAEHAPQAAQGREAGRDGEGNGASRRRLLLGIAFLSGLAALSCEVLWIRHLVFVVPSSQYSFSGILGVFLVALALGSLGYRAFLAGRRRQLLWLAAIECALGVLIVGTLLASTELSIHTALSARPRAAPGRGALHYKTRRGQGARRQHGGQHPGLARSGERAHSSAWHPVGPVCGGVVRVRGRDSCVLVCKWPR